MLYELNHWLSSNQLFLFSLLMPITSGAVAFFSSRYATRLAVKNSRSDRSLQKELKLAEFQQEWINDFRNEISILQGYVLAYEHVPSDEFGKHVGKLVASIQLRLDHDDPDRAAMMTSLKGIILDAQGKKSLDSEPINIVGQRILKREWEKLKSGLEAANEVIS
jgi:phosphate/sulfate permease